LHLRFDHRPFLYNFMWPWQFSQIDNDAARSNGKVVLKAVGQNEVDRSSSRLNSLVHLTLSKSHIDKLGTSS
jgi:hypothetical protein